MSDIQTALKIFNEALTNLENKLPAALSQYSQSHQMVADLETECAHLRAEVSALKKEMANHKTVNGRATQQIETALNQIDALLNGDSQHG